MSMTSYLDTITAEVRDQLDGAESLSTVATMLFKARESLEDDQANELTDEALNQIARELVARKPSLLVDWGTHPRMGHRVEPCFQILCPGFEQAPRVNVSISRELDHDPPDIYPRSKEDGLWEFGLPFSLTTDGDDCRPGQYNIHLSLSFPETPSPSLARFYHCDIRLNIKDSSLGEEPVLEIEGDGQSVINLQGYDLTAYSKVKLKAAEGAIINLNKPGGTTTAQPPPPPKQPVTYEYELKVDRGIELQVPFVSQQFGNRPRMEKAMFVTEDDRRIILLAKRVTSFGRNVQNDVVVRYLPRSESNDDLSRDISRLHMSLEISNQGLLIHDKSSKGIEVDFEPVETTHTLTAENVDDEIRLFFGTNIMADRFEFEMQLFGAERNQHDQFDLLRKDNLFADDSGQRFDRAGRLADNCEINAVRLRRSSNLKSEEYVIVYRHVFVGSSSADSAITLSDFSLKPRHARIIYLSNTFWLENLQKHGAVRVGDASIAPREMVPLEPGMKIHIGDSRLEFETATQIGFDS
jgi:hypothetical protein